jgi:hypothetical protein
LELAVVHCETKQVGRECKGVKKAAHSSSGMHRLITLGGKDAATERGTAVALMRSDSGGNVTRAAI